MPQEKILKSATQNMLDVLEEMLGADLIDEQTADDSGLSKAVIQVRKALKKS